MILKIKKQCKNSFKTKLHILKKLTISKLKKILPLLIIFAAFSCEYEPTGSNFKDIKIEEPVFYINLNNQRDTVIISGDANLHYSIDLDGRKIKRLEMFLDDRKLYYGNDDTGTIYFYSDNYTNGYHKLRIEFVSNSGTGSMADHLGAEQLQAVYEWILFVDNYPPPKISINKIEKYNGGIRINWNSYEESDFQYYSVNKGYLNRTNSPPFMEVKKIYNRKDTTYFDESYIGGEYAYRIDIVAGDKMNAGLLKTLNEESPQILSYEWTNDNKIKMTWTKSDYENNFTRYEFHRDLSGSPPPSEKFFMNINDTSGIVDDAYFGSSYNYYLTLISKGGKIPKSDLVEIIPDKKIMAFNRMIFSESLNSIYLIDERGAYDHKILRLDPDSFEILAESPSLFSNIVKLSPDGTKLYALLNGSFAELNPYNLTIKENIDFPENLPDNSFPKNFAVSDNNQFMFINTILKYTSSYYYDANYFYDAGENKLIGFNGNSMWSDIDISGDGTHIIDGNILYEVEDSALTMKKEMDSYYSHHFYFDNPVIISIGENVKLSNMRSLSTISSYNYEKMGKNFSFSRDRKYLYGKYNNSFYVYKIDNPAPLQEVKTVEYELYLIKDNLFSKEGYHLKLDLEQGN